MFRNKLILALALLVGFVVQANAFTNATIYVDTGGCNSGSTTQCSGTTDSATASASGASATITCSAVAGPAGAPGCSITGSAGQLSGIAVDGSQALFINCATNTLQKIFFINAVDDGAGLVGTTVTPTGCTAATSNWGIGGRYIMPSGASNVTINNAIRAGDTVQFNNTPATRTQGYFSGLAGGDSTNGLVKIIGKAGVDHPLLQISSGNITAITLNSSGLQLENLSFQTTGTTNAALLAASGNSHIYKNIKFVSTTSANCITDAGGGSLIIDSEITGCGGDGISTTGANIVIQGNYIHGNTGSGINFTAVNPLGNAIGNIIANNTANGISVSGASSSQNNLVAILNNTIYGNGSPNVEVVNANSRVFMRNNIISNASAVDIVKWDAGTAQLVSTHTNNDFYSSGGGVLNGLTANSTESTSNPGLSNPGSGAFVITSSSPAASTGQPGAFLGSSTGYLDMGGVQHQGSGGSCIGC